jgi:hypothetical protein
LPPEKPSPFTENAVPLLICLKESLPFSRKSTIGYKDPSKEEHLVPHQGAKMFSWYVKNGGGFHTDSLKSRTGLFYAPANAFLHARLVLSREAIFLDWPDRPIIDKEEWT